MIILADLFKQNADLYGSKPCIKVYNPSPVDSATEVLTYEQFHATLRQQARHLTDAYALHKGDTIAILADNSLAYVILVFAATLAGIRVLLISTKVLPEHLQHFLDSTQCKLILTSPAYDKLAAATGFTTARLATANQTAPLADHTEAAAVAFPTADLQASDCALIMHTSGTTSVPRLVYLSHQNILANQEAVQLSVAEYWTLDDSSLAFLPLFHGYTLLSQLLRNLFIGATTVLWQASENSSSENLSPENLITALARSGVSFFCCVPWMLKLIHALVLAEQKTGSSHALNVMQNLNFIITGGAPLERTTGDFFTANGVRIVTFFGLTEAAGFVLHSSFTNKHWDLLHPVADPGIGFIPVPAGADEHELVLRASPLVALTSDSSATDIPAARRSYSTSDLFRPAAEGWAYVGRNDLLYNGPHGEKINPLLFEAELAKEPAVHKVYVSGEDLLFNVALVELKPEFAGNLQATEALLARIQSCINPLLEMPARVYPNDVIVLGAGETLLLTPKGTVNRKAARALLASRISARDPHTHAHARQTNDIPGLVRKQIRAYLEFPPDYVIPDSVGLLELGFDSLMILSLRNTLQQQLQLELPLELMLGFPTVSTLVAALHALQATAQPLPASDLPVAAGQWARIPLEQVLFHTAYYTFPFPTYNVSMSLLAPQRLTRQEIENGLQYLEAKHEVLRSVYTQEGLFRIENRSFVTEALLGITEINGSHNIEDNPEAQAIIAAYLNCAFDLNNGPVYRYALINVTSADQHTRTLVYVGLHHIAGDFKGFNGMVGELMEYLEDKEKSSAVTSDNYAGLVKHPAPPDLQSYQNCWLRLLTVMPELKEGLDFRAGHRQYFQFPDIKLNQVANILRKHNISLYNGVYAIYIVALSRHLSNQSLEDFQSATAVTSRLTSATENLMGCFIHSPILRFHLDKNQSMLQMMTETQHTTLHTFTRMISNPAACLQDLVNDPTNLVPFLSRNVFLYRSPDEIMSPAPGWNSYRNEFFFESCDVGMYLDFCANRESRAMEGYVLINLHYCEPQIIQPILDDIRTLLLQVIDDPELGFSPIACLQ